MPHPDYVPQLATLVDRAPSGDEWFHEIKYDGYRIGARVRKGQVSLYTRNGNDWTASFPPIADAVRKLDLDDALIDGEAAVVLPDGRTSFQAMQNAGDAANRGTVVYFVFDLLRLNGATLEALPLEERKARLRKLVGGRKTGRIRFSEHIEGNGQAFFDHACRAGLEGIVSKRRDQPYRAGRHGGWLKTKCSKRQEFVIGGFTDPEGMRAGLGALLIGYYDRDRLVFCGKVGTGFTQKLALELRAKLDRLEQKTSPFTPPPEGSLGRNAHWVKPELVCEVVFTEWTTDGKIRHPSFQGLRADKKPKQVTREKPQRAFMARSARTSQGNASRQGLRHGDKDRVAGVVISHPDRVVYPDPGLSKLDVARYYESIADWIVPHVAGRPLTLVRCPEGISGDCFFMKHSKLWAPPALRRVRIKEKTKLGEYLIADDIAGVVSLAQMGVLEIHTWNAVFADVERPNRIVFDLDPGEQVEWAAVVRGARMVRDALAALQLESYVKTTGGRGVHVVVPLAPHADWAQCLEFSRTLSERFEAAQPDLYTTAFAKAGRARKILIDYLRNNRTNTSIAAYSTRARAGAPVSVPLTWDELRTSLSPQSFTVLTVAKRLEKLKADPWKSYGKSRQKLTAQLIRAARGG
ncbi:MAG TPA: DNA ligase D [Vicinamibacterales bacterium]|jgi:bifunctional non-homologous end joining protein LigD